ncbi:RAB26 protein, partial [Malurus elegans]|nr:RAB26 protein [Malurus elegans]
QTILVGDSGVGKTSLLVQFDQGKFIPGSFSATVGIGFTVRAQFLILGCALTLGSSFIWGMRIYESVVSTKNW